MTLGHDPQEKRVWLHETTCFIHWPTIIRPDTQAYLNDSLILDLPVSAPNPFWAQTVQIAMYYFATMAHGLAVKRLWLKGGDKAPLKWISQKR